MKMSAKLVYSLRDNENPDLHKQIGCMNGFFQLFDRHRRITGHGRRITNNAQPQNTPLQSGQNRNQRVEANDGLEKAREKNSKKDAKDQKRRSSTESSRHSFSSSSCSSSTFSSLDLNTKSANSSSGTELSGDRQSSTGQLSRSSVDLRDVVKDCMRREARGGGRESPIKTVVREQHVDSPRPRRSFGDHHIPRRLSYDGGGGARESRDSLRSAPRLSLDSHRQGSSTSPAAKPLLRDLRIERRTVDQAASLIQEPGSSRRASSVVAKLMGLVDPVPEPVAAPLPPPLEAERVPRKKKAGQKNIPIETAPWRQRSTMATTPLTVFGEIEKRLADLEFKKSGKDLRALKQILEAMQKSKVAEKDAKLASQAKAPIVIMRPAKTVEVEKQTTTAAAKQMSPNARVVRPVQTRKTAGSSQENAGRISGNSSPRLSPKRVAPLDSNIRRKQNGRESPERKLRPRSVQGNASPLQSESNLSLGSEDIDADVTSSVLRPHQNRIVGLGVNRTMAEPGRVTTPEQPSPVSVLDSTFYRGDESPSPVKKTLIAFKDDDILYPDEDEWTIMNLDQQSIDGGRSSLSLEETSFSSMFFSETTDPDHIYISDILSSSSSSDRPIEPHLFFALEHRRHRSIAQPRHEKLHRKLVFDVVGEILDRKQALARGSEKNILGELCSEVDQLQGKNSGEEDRSESIVRDDMARRPMNRREYGREIPAVVLDLERLIFKDLVTELINGLKTRPRGHCKQLRFN